MGKRKALRRRRIASCSIAIRSIADGSTTKQQLAEREL